MDDLKSKATIPIVDPTTNGFRLQIGGPDNDIDEVSISGFVIGTHSHTNHQTKLGNGREKSGPAAGQAPRVMGTYV